MRKDDLVRLHHMLDAAKEALSFAADFLLKSPMLQGMEDFLALDSTRFFHSS